ncbi:hypothetical protein Patl1_18524 [Pistacia atlantica]|uniref:Uncharacterized protein n=1 Tax=Pistacia atlantica TaxID=434234 RepID=A0ACC1BY00_9ROSI|nr:hypothetical protein Patl1_18524 [Pistacia atlantica]
MGEKGHIPMANIGQIYRLSEVELVLMAHFRATVVWMLPPTLLSGVDKIEFPWTSGWG